jgi:hypothetical protein
MNILAILFVLHDVCNATLLPFSLRVETLVPRRETAAFFPQRIGFCLLVYLVTVQSVSKGKLFS